jgi:endogenous inhibitor of DNA gyrase (YacG/DUF329 family)
MSKKRPDSICQYCGKSYHPKTADRTTYCSRECYFASGKIGRWKLKKETTQKVWYCKICNKPMDTYHVYCSDECRKQRERDRYYANHDHNLELARIRDSKKITPKHEVVCGECGKVFMQEYRNTRSVYCSDQCMKRSVNRNAHHIRRIRFKDGFVESVYKARIFKRDNGMCQICGKKVSVKQKAPHPYSASLDHIIPLAKGGTHEPKNVRLVHFICNSIKSDGVSNGGDQLLLFG